MTTSLYRLRALVLVASCFPVIALASEPASHEVTAPAAGGSVTVEWTGTAQPGATGAAGAGAVASSEVGTPNPMGCPPTPADDSHDIAFTLPDSLSGEHVIADFTIEFDLGDDYVVANSHDLALSVYDGTTLLGHSDGGSPSETVTLDNPASATYTAVVCPFTASEPVPYRAKLTVKTLAPAACVVDAAHAVPNALVASGAGFVNPDARGLPNFDVFSIETRNATRFVPTDFHGRFQPAIVDRTLGVPTFLWARTDATAPAVGALNARDLLVESARAHLRNEAKELRLTPAMIDQAQAFDAQFNGDGAAVVRFRQTYAGTEVFHRSLNVMLDRSLKPVAVSGYFAQGAPTAARALGSAEAIAAAWTNLGGALSATALVPAGTRGGWDLFQAPLVSGTHYFERGPRAKAVWFPRAGGLEPAWVVEVFAKAKLNGQLMAYSLVVSAADGRVLKRDNLSADAGFTYRVFADPKGPLHQPYDSPLGNGYAPFPAASPRARINRVGAGSQLVTLENSGISTNDPWLADDATSTVGNHVDACIDRYDQGVDTPAGGLAVPPPVNSCVHEPADVEPRAATTGDHTFDYPIAADDNPATADAQNAAVVNLFYMNNWLHDWWYNHGFDEVSGNAQTSNYGRGGEEGDPVLAQGQDASGRSNANMATPSDGSSPVMQQYLFDGALTGEVREVAPVAGEPLTWTAIADTGKPEYDLTGTLALANDGVGNSMTDGCGPAIPYPDPVVEQGLPLPLGPVGTPDPNLKGKIALVDRGGCNTTYKIQFAMASGAVGLIVVNNVDGDPPTNIGNLDIPLSPVEPTHYVYQQMPTVIIRKDDGEALKAQLAAGEVTMHLQRAASVDVDGTLDNQIIAHEYFHYVHHRLTDSSNTQADAMSEGWGDIDAFMLTVRGDDRGAMNGGAFGLASYVTNNFWSGIRRAPYSTDMEKNGFTLRHIQEGEPTPDGGSGAGNSEVHSAGEIWANMMFECYAGIQANPHNQFLDARSKMQDYIIAGLKLTPADATYTEARDAILAAALASDFGDFTACSAGFAKRGAGLNAVAPARSSTDLVGVTEDYHPFVCLAGGNGGGNGGGGDKVEETASGGALGFAALLPLLGAALARRRRRPA